MWRERIKVALLCAVLVFSTTMERVNGATLNTRNIGGVYVYSSMPPAAAAFLYVASQTLGRITPWAAAVTTGMQVGKMIADAAEGSMVVSTRGLTDADRPEITTPANATFEVKEFCGAGSAGIDVTDGVYSRCVAPGLAFACGPCTVLETPLKPNGVGHDIKYVANGQNPLTDWHTTQSTYAGRCLTGTAGQQAWTFTIVPGNFGAACPDAGTTTKGGTRAWAPRSMQQPDGSTAMGWEAPTDPTMQPQMTNPTDVLYYPPALAGQVQPQATFTPNADGGYTFQTWSPNYTTVNNVTTQNGWTVQTTTVNNAGAVTNTTIVTNSSNGPPTPNAPTGNGTGTPAQPVTCGSLSCESTQQAIKTEITGVHQDTTAIKTELQAVGAPTLPDQSAALTAAKSADKGLSDAAIGAITGAQGGDESKWFQWAFTPPAGSCEPPTATLSHGVVVSFNYCPMVANIRSLIGWLFAVFASWHIYNVLFRRGND